MEKPAPVYKTTGSKWRDAKWIISHFPPHGTYVEPFMGSAAVFFTKPKSKVEILNDRNNRIVNLFRILREKPDDLACLLSLTPFSREEYRKSYEVADDALEDARRMVVRSWQAHGLKATVPTGWRIDYSAKVGSLTQEWTGLGKRIETAALRLREALIENSDAVDLVGRCRWDHTLIYADPPYILPAGKNGIYTEAMSEEDHARLLDALNAHPGYVVLSGYDSPLYEGMLAGWEKREKAVRGDKGVKRTEVLWISPRTMAALQDEMPTLEIGGR